MVKFSYVKTHSEILRLDSFYYAKNFLREESIIKRIENKTLKELNASLISFGAYSLNNFVEYQESGIPFIRGVNMKNGFIDFTDMYHITKDAHKLLWKSEVKPNTLLLSMSGSIGDVALSTPEYDYPMNSNQDIAKIDLKGSVNIYYVYSFLRSKFGQNFLIREARGSVQQHVFLSQLETLRIPILSDAFQKQIEQTVKSAHSNFTESKELYAKAEGLLLHELGLKDWQPQNNAVSVKSLSDMDASGRLDAEYYQSKYDEIEEKIKSYKGGCATIGSVAKIKDANFFPNSQKKYKYIELADIGSFGEVKNCMEELGKNLPSRARRFVKARDLLVSSIEGSLQSCAIVPEEFDGGLCSTGFYVLQSEKINAETLLMLIKSNCIQSLLKKNCSGTILTAISKDSFKKVIIPLLAPSIQKEIAVLVQKSFSLKAQSASLLREAKRAVENAIEDGK